MMHVCVCWDQDRNGTGSDHAKGEGGSSNEDGGELHFDGCGGMVRCLRTVVWRIKSVVGSGGKECGLVGRTVVVCNTVELMSCVMLFSVSLTLYIYTMVVAMSKPL